MNKNEQDMIRKIKEKSEQVPVPKALEPRQIEAKLAGKKKKVWTPARISGLAAACLVLIVGVMVYQNYFKMEDATRDDKIACSDVTISDSTKVESAAEYKDVYAYLEKYKKDQERDSAYTSSGARSLKSIPNWKLFISCCLEICLETVWILKPMCRDITWRRFFMRPIAALRICLPDSLNFVW